MKHYRYKNTAGIIVGKSASRIMEMCSRVFWIMILRALTHDMGELKQSFIVGCIGGGGGGILGMYIIYSVFLCCDK